MSSYTHSSSAGTVVATMLKNFPDRPELHKLITSCILLDPPRHKSRVKWEIEVRKADIGPSTRSASTQNPYRPWRPSEERQHAVVSRNTGRCLLSRPLAHAFLERRSRCWSLRPRRLGWRNQGQVLPTAAPRGGASGHSALARARHVEGADTARPPAFRWDNEVDGAAAHSGGRRRVRGRRIGGGSIPGVVDGEGPRVEGEFREGREVAGAQIRHGRQGTGTVD